MGSWSWCLFLRKRFSAFYFLCRLFPTSKIFPRFLILVIPVIRFYSHLGITAAAPPPHWPRPSLPRPCGEESEEDRDAAVVRGRDLRRRNSRGSPRMVDTNRRGLDQKPRRGNEVQVCFVLGWLTTRSAFEVFRVWSVLFSVVLR